MTYVPAAFLDIHRSIQSKQDVKASHANVIQPKQEPKLDQTTVMQSKEEMKMGRATAAQASQGHKTLGTDFKKWYVKSKI